MFGRQKEIWMKPIVKNGKEVPHTYIDSNGEITKFSFGRFDSMDDFFKAGMSITTIKDGKKNVFRM